MLFHNVLDVLIFIVLVCIIIYLLKKSANFKLSKCEYNCVTDTLMKTPYSTCLINLFTNKIIMANNDFCKMFDNDDKSFIDMNITNLNLFNSYEQYVRIKKKCQSEISNYAIITKDINNKKYIYKISYSLIKIGFKKYMLMSVEDKTNIIDYIKRLGIFTKIADNSKEGIIVVNFKGEKNTPFITYANDNISDITGYCIDEIVNKPLAILFETNVKEETLSELYDKLRNKETATLEYQYIKRDGTICWIKTDMVPIVRQSILNKLIENDTDNELEGLDNILNITDFEVYITLYQTDITQNKQNYELPMKAYMNKISEYDKSMNKFLTIIDSLLNMSIVADDRYKSEIVKQITSIVCQASDSDKCYIYKIIDDKIKLQSVWRTKEFEFRDFNVIENMTFEEAGLFRLYGNLIMNKPLFANRDDIGNNVYAKQLFEMNDIKAVLIYPIMKNGKLLGFIGINSSKDNKEWDNNIKKLMQIVADKLGNII